MEEHLDRYRMYGLVPYNISPIQQGIQYGHALQELNNLVVDTKLHAEVDGCSQDTKSFLKEFDEWRLNDKTFIILNGGTSFTMDEHVKTLEENGVVVGVFREPDLNNMVSGIVFLVPEQVYKREDYPDFDDSDLVDPTGQLPTDQFKELRHQQWVEFMGGRKNVFLREFTRQFRLA